MVRTSPDGGVANTTAVVRIMNERAVYEQTRQLGQVSASQLVTATGLSKPTIGLALANLERSGLVRHVGHRVGQVGRAPRLYEVRPEAGWALAVDIGASWLRAAVADLSGRITVQHEERVRARTAASLIRQVGDLTEMLSAKAGIAFTDVTHTVLGIPGVYEPESGRISAAPNLPGWDQPGAVESLRTALGERFSIDNDVNLATLAEQAYGLGAAVRDFVFVSVGTGVGMGVVVDGRLYRGSHGRAGEISFLPVGDEGAAKVHDSATTRQHGILETAASADGIVGTAVGYGMTVDSAEQVFNAARSGDAAALRVVELEADHLARALTSIIAVLDPGLIVLGGGVGSNVDVLLAPIQRRLGELLALEPPPIRVSAVGRENVVLGGLAAGLDVARDAVLAQIEV
ncbi:MAG TPA: ROK family protein [Pseudonocardiaceae bacterium]|nr:ROK family protein [Pseudonocardiaceae bacterium]